MASRRSLQFVSTHVLVLIVGLCHVQSLVGDEKKDTKRKPISVTSMPQVAPSIHQALQSRQYDKAVTLIDAQLTKADAKHKDYLLYLKGRALIESTKLDAATAAFNRLEKSHPKSRWLPRSRFGRADVLVRQRNYRAAGLIYQAEANRLLSGNRRDELAGIYLEFADKYFEGIVAKDPSGKPKPDYKQALTYYTEALKLNPGLKTRQKVELRIAHSHRHLGQLDPAIKGYIQFIETHASKKTAKADQASDSMIVDARYQLGHAELAANRFKAARRTWQDFLASEVAKRAGGKWLAEASYRLAHTHRIPSPPSVSEMELGIAAHERFLKAFPKSELAPQASFEIAQSYINRGRDKQAVDRLKTLIETTDAKAKQVPLARNMLGHAYATQKKFPEAIVAWKDFLDKHPSDRNWAGVQRQVINTEYLMASVQRDEKNYEQARELWSTFLNKYPLDPRASQILFSFGDMKFAAAAEQLKKQRDAAKAGVKIGPNAATKKIFQEAISDWRRLVSKYPGTNEASRAAFVIGTTLEDQLAQLADALEAYKKVSGQYANAANQRIQRLTAKQLEVVTERKFHSDEKARIKVTTRNVADVNVRIYRIDMVSYFRKMHLASGVEALDIALIDPDKSWDHKVADFEKYRRTENEIEIPVEGPGVTAVTVTGEKLEATTMLIVSDIDVIAKASRNELFVFAQNLRTGKPVPGTSLLISDGKEVFAEEVTGENGVMQKSFEQLKSVKDLRVFAVHEGHAASTINNLDGLSFAVGLAPKGFLFVDRPAYRAGQLVNLKGIIRWVAEDRYTFKPGEKYQLDVYDARGRLFHTRHVTLNSFGTLAGNFELPDSSPVGEYRVHVHQPGGKQSYETQFVVHEFELDSVRLNIELDKSVYHRGDTVNGTITLKYYYGTPLANKIVTYDVLGRRFTRKTDRKGRIKFDVSTREFQETVDVSISASFPEKNVSASVIAHVATRGFAIHVDTVRKVYISGETFDSTIKVSDPAGEPVATDLKLEILERTRVNGRRGELLVESFETKSDKNGDAHRTVSVDKSGTYIIRATGTDQFGNTLSGSHVVTISGDDDKIRLRLLADKHQYNVGDKAQVKLHWRENDALALVTYEGASILGYQLVSLKKGSNNLVVPMDASLAPNFNLSVAVMHDSKFHQTESEFRVSRRLNIKLKPNKTKLKPGDEFVVDITTTSPQGTPVSAEVALGLIQQNLLNRFGGENSLSVIDQFFGQGYRQPQIRAVSSCTFMYTPATQAVNEFLLAEQNRASFERASGIAMIAMRKARTDREIANFVDQVDDLLSRGRVNEADRIAAHARNLDPTNPLSIKMQQKAALTRRYSGSNQQREALFDALEGLVLVTDGSNNGQNDSVALGMRQSVRLGGQQGQAQRAEDFNANGLPTSESINGIGQTLRGVPFTSGTAVQDRDGLQELIARERIQSDNWTGVTATGSMDKFTTTLSLIVRQQQDVQQVMDHFYSDLAQAKNTVVGLNGRGEFLVMNNLAKAEFEKAVADGIQLLPKMGNSELGYWNPAIVTDKKGQAKIKFRLPERSTAWTLQARGVDLNAMTGQASLNIVSKKDLFAELRAPLAFTTQDEASVLVEVHNSTVKKGGEIAVVLRTTIGDATSEIRKVFKTAGAGVEELEFPIKVTNGDAVQFELSVTSGELKDSSTQTVQIRPFGVSVFATASGSSSQSTIAFVEHNKGMPVENSKLELLIGPSINRSLLESVLGANHSNLSSRWASAVERSISDVLGGVSLLKTINAQKADTLEAAALTARVNSGVARLISSQRNDGAWSWSGRHSAKSDRYITSRAVWALSLAKRAGLVVPAGILNAGVARLKTLFTSSSTSDREGQAIILHGLAQAGQADFAFANRLYRERNNLSVSGLLHVALTLIELDRKEMAADLLELVDLPTTSQNGQTEDVLRCIPWMQSGVELRALHLMALEVLHPTDNSAKETAAWLMAARTGFRWQQEKANGPAIVALADWFARTKFADEKYKLIVSVNEKEVETLDIDPAVDGTRRVSIPAATLLAGKPNKISMQLAGRGRFSYSAILSGSVPADMLKNTTNAWRVIRHAEPAHRMLDGQVVPRGFNIATGEPANFRNPLTQLPVGDKAEITLQVDRRNVRGTKDEQLDYLVVSEPLPAGSVVLEDSIRGSFERYEIGASEITFYLGDQASPKDIKYTLVGHLAGQYRTVPTVVRSFYRPDRIAVGAPQKLSVLPQGAETVDKYKLSPVELFEFGKRTLAKNENAAAAKHLTELFKGYQLNANVYKQVVQMLFKASLAIKNHRAIVDYFEIIKEKYPDVEIAFDSIMKVATAYQELGEYERSYLVFRATIESAFERESQIAGFLVQRNEFVRSVEVMERLLGEYPAESYIAIATFALAGEVYTKSPECASNKRLRELGITDVDLISSSIHMHDHILSTWPSDPAADRVSFSMANAVLDLEDYGQAIKLCDAFATRYPKSTLLDSFWYVIGYSQFALGEHETALAMCKKVAETKRKDVRTGAEIDAANKWQAIYIMGQIYHSLGQPANAILQYKKVKNRFADAAEAISFFTRQEISLPEVSTIKPGADGKVELKFRNVKEANIKVYRIDLLKFGLMQRNLNRITAINLAGIRPYHEMTVELGDGNDFKDRKQALKLPLKEEGAYLVVGRGDNLYASGLVLVSPLVLEVQEDATSGRVRVTVKNQVSDKYLKSVLVKVIGSSNKDFNTGETDLRGIFVADAIRGTSTIIARADGDRYAFYRGKTQLGPAPQPQRASKSPSLVNPQTPSSGKSELLRNLMDSNGEIQRGNSLNFKNLIENSTKGVKAKTAF
jgi:alpha-2-macroglobulin